MVKNLWNPGIVYLETVEAGNSTFTMHRCWNVDRFKEARRDEAVKATANGKPRAVRFLTADEFRKAGGR